MCNLVSFENLFLNTNTATGSRCILLSQYHLTLQSDMEGLKDTSVSFQVFSILAIPKDKFVDNKASSIQSGSQVISAADTKQWPSFMWHM